MAIEWVDNWGTNENSRSDWLLIFKESNYQWYLPRIQWQWCQEQCFIKPKSMLAPTSWQTTTSYLNNDDSNGNDKKGYVVSWAASLYGFALNATSKPAMFINVYLVLGGLHLLMSCIDFIVTLLGETGLAEVLKSFIVCFFWEWWRARSIHRMSEPWEW